MTYGYLDFAYELRTPDPLKMSSGNYTGTLRYSMGPRGDFDFGDVMIPDDTELTLDFNLEVQHTLKVDIPPGGEKFAWCLPVAGKAGCRPDANRCDCFAISLFIFRPHRVSKCTWNATPAGCSNV